MKGSALFCLLMVLCGGALCGTFAPFYANVETNGAEFFAVRPFYSRTDMPAGQIQDFLWPLYSRKEFKDEQTSRFMVFWFTHDFNASDDVPRVRRWLLPFYFQGRDVHGENYFALFPLGGTIHEFIGRDRMSFVLFPLYGSGQINDVRTVNVLWPVISHTRGDGVARDRVFPFYGRSARENQFDKKFVLWPFWTSAEFYYPGQSGSSWIFFPFYGRTDTEIERTRWYFPPFFRFTDGEKQDRVFCPWPLFQKVSSENMNKLYVWPFWGEAEYDEGLTHRNFLLWPVFSSSRTVEADVIAHRRRAAPVFVFEKKVLRDDSAPAAELSEVSRYWHVWPLMSYRRAGESSRVRLLELWPIKDSPPVERNWSPLWTLYRRTDNAGVVENDTLWFVWHSEKEAAAERREWSLLKGFVSYKKEPENRQLRLLWVLRFGGD